MVGDEMPGEIARTDDRVIDLVRNLELAQLPLHRIRRSRRVGDEDYGAALLAKAVKGLAGIRECGEAVVNHAPDVAEQDLCAANDVAQPFGKSKRRHVACQTGPAARRASAALPVARAGSIAGLPEPLVSCALL
jgi:hypothetical protein